MGMTTSRVGSVMDIFKKALPQELQEILDFIVSNKERFQSVRLRKALEGILCVMVEFYQYLKLQSEESNIITNHIIWPPFIIDVVLFDRWWDKHLTDQEYVTGLTILMTDEFA